MTVETYFLSSLESALFEETRKCLFIKRLHFNSGKECALVRLSPNVIGQSLGIGQDLETFVLSNRHEGERLFPITEFPCFVFVARPLITGIEACESIDKSDLEIVAWGELYRTRRDAENHVFES